MEEARHRGACHPILSHFVAVQSPSRVRLFSTPWTAACQASLPPTIAGNLPKFMSITSVKLNTDKQIYVVGSRGCKIVGEGVSDWERLPGGFGDGHVSVSV